MEEVGTLFSDTANRMYMKLRVGFKSRMNMLISVFVLGLICARSEARSDDGFGIGFAECVITVDCSCETEWRYSDRITEWNQV